MTDPTPAPGSWPSPLTAAQVATAAVAYGQVAVTDGGATVWWSESRPDEAGRTTVLRRSADGPAQEVLPPQLDARTRVHEYGGACWTPYGDGLVTSNLRDQRLWLVGDGGPRPLTPDTGLVDRYAEPRPLPSGTHVLCVRERVGERTVHELVAVPLDGSGEVVVLWDGSDFVGSARVAPDGSRLAFVTWDHPRMPWDGSELRVAPLLPGPALGEAAVVLGGPEEAVQTPHWEDAHTLRAVTDRSGWWNVVRLPADGDEPVPAWPVAQECGWPMWRLGYDSHVSLTGGRAAVLHDGRLAVLDRDGASERTPDVSTAGERNGDVSTAGERGADVSTAAGRADRATAATAATDVDLPFTGWSPFLAADGDVVVGVATTPTTSPRVVAVDTAAGTWREVAGPEQPDPAWAPAPETVEVPSAGRTTYAHVYPPTSPHHEAAGGAPYVVFVHGGPTANVQKRYDPQIAWFTSRGIGVADVDYGGSTGYGRAYREALRGQWGVVDVEDCEAVARWLLETGRAGKVAIRGGSAGGWTVLCALTRGGSVFAAGTSLFGVADAVALAEHTHDFESRYLDGLLGPLPEAREVYDARSPLTHADRLDRPLLLLQGLDDPVVPPAQAERFLAALEGKPVPHAYLAFAGEAHGFRRADTIVAALEAELSFYGQTMGFEPAGVPVLPLEGVPQ